MNESDRDASLTQLLRDSDPWTGGSEAEVSALDRAWARLEPELTASSVVVPLRRRRVRAVIAGTAALAVVLGGTAVAADLLRARTGVPSAPAPEVGEFAPGEEIDFSAPDLRQAVLDLTRDVPFPSDAARTYAVGQRDFEPETGAGKSTGSSAAIRAWMARYAVCAWSADLATADAVGDASRKSADAAQLVGAPSWKAFSLVDGSGQLNAATAQLREDAFLRPARAIADAAGTGDAAAVKGAVEASTWCMFYGDPVPSPGASAPGGTASPDPAATQSPTSTTSPRPTTEG